MRVGLCLSPPLACRHPGLIDRRNWFSRNSPNLSEVQYSGCPIHVMFEETMFDTSTESLSTPARPRHPRANGHMISVSDHVSRPLKSARFSACAAPFLACKNSIMQGEDGVSRCNSPFLHCKRYVYGEGSIDAGSSLGTKNMRESMIGTK